MINRNEERILYTVELKIKKSVKFYKEDLIALEKIVNSHFLKSDRKEDLEIAVHFKDRSLYKNSLEEIFAENLPKVTEHFSLRKIGWNEEHQINKVVDILMINLVKTIRIRGDNQVWVVGMREVLNQFFNERKTFYSGIRETIPFIGGGLAGISLVTMQISFKEGNDIIGILSTLTAVIAIILSLSSSFNKFLPYTKMYLHSKTSNSVNHQTINSYIATFFGFLTLVATIIIAYLTLR